MNKFLLLFSIVISGFSYSKPLCIKTDGQVKTYIVDAIGESISLPIRMTPNISQELIIGSRSQGEIIYGILQDGSRNLLNLPIKDLPSNIDEYDDNFDFDKNVQMEATLLDIMGNGSKQIAVVYCRPNDIQSAVNIFEYKNKNWQLVFKDKFSEKIEFSGKKIIMPYGFQGAFSEYEYVNGKFRMNQ